MRGANLMKYIWTKYAEERAKELGRPPRKAGTEASCGGEPISRPMSLAWIDRGLIEAVEENNGENQMGEVK